MVALSKLAFTAGLLNLFGGVLAHPKDAESAQREALLRRVVSEENRRALEACYGSPEDVALKQRAVDRRDAKLKSLRQAQGIPTYSPLTRRTQADLAKWAAISHKSTAGYTLNTDPSVIFAQNASCVIVPETTIGPYWVEGELIRTDITDGQTGVKLHLDIQFVDVTTCKGVPSLLIDAWHTNATGVYSGVSASGQGGLKTTFARGVQQTDSDGVVEFDTLFPGHYAGRAVHIHIKSTSGATIYQNNTYVNGVTHHIGQLFFDQSLISLVEATSPYSTNRQSLTLNSADSIAWGEATSTYDPFVEYVLLGSSVSQGLLGWITVGINPKADYSNAVSAAAHYYAGGGVDTSTGGGGPPRQ